MVGFEPTTTRLKVRCSNQLSYIPFVLKFNFTKKKINKNFIKNFKLILFNKFILLLLLKK